jgi:hypothetical protein
VSSPPVQAAAVKRMQAKVRRFMTIIVLALNGILSFCTLGPPGRQWHAGVLTGMLIGHDPG